jgi:hypothetical protein
MDNPALEKFIARALHARRIGFGDLRRLQRDILPEGISTPAEAEALLALDDVVSKVDGAWPSYLSALCRNFVLRLSPAGGVEPNTLAWLVDCLSGAKPATALFIARELVRVADVTDPTLLALTRRRPSAKNRAQVPMSEPVALQA